MPIRVGGLTRMGEIRSAGCFMESTISGGSHDHYRTTSLNVKCQKRWPRNTDNGTGAIFREIHVESFFVSSQGDALSTTYLVGTKTGTFGQVGGALHCWVVRAKHGQRIPGRWSGRASEAEWISRRRQGPNEIQTRPLRGVSITCPPPASLAGAARRLENAWRPTTFPRAQLLHGSATRLSFPSSGVGRLRPDEAVACLSTESLDPLDGSRSVVPKQ